MDTQNELRWDGNGGDHRALQIADLLARAGLRVRRPAQPPTTMLGRHLRGLRTCGLRGYPIHLDSRQRSRDRGRQAMSNAGHVAQRYEEAFSSRPPPALLVWENADNAVGAGIARRRGCPVIAAPQNLYTVERGFRDFWTGAVGLEALARELDFLRSCEAVFAISREEQWLLRLQGVSADFLPYHPPAELERCLLEVRARRAREAADGRRFLVIGSATHPPTAESMRTQLRSLAPIARDDDFHVDVAGHGTEQLRDLQHEAVTIHGTVSQSALSALLARASAAIIEQRPSVGSLTRIPELLVAGVPVIADVNASRSTWGMHGVLHYETAAELRELIRGPLPSAPPPVRAEAAEARFCAAARRLAFERPTRGA